MEKLTRDESDNSNQKLIGQSSIVEFIEHRIRVLEMLFHDQNLDHLRAFSPDHPAVKQFDALKNYTSGNMISTFPDESDFIESLGQSLMDLMVGYEAKNRDDLYGAFGDQNVKKFIEDRISSRDKYRDVMAQIICKNLLCEYGLPAKLIEHEGFPDIKIEVGNDITWIEVKHIQKGTSTSRIKKVIEKANRQIKLANADKSGALMIILDRPDRIASIDDSILQDVEIYINEIERHISGNTYKSVARIILIWEDYLIDGDPPGTVQYVYRRRAKVFNHINPRSVVRLPNELDNMIWWIKFYLDWRIIEPLPIASRPNSIKSGNILITERFRADTEQMDYIRAEHAIAGLKSADAINIFDFGDTKLVLCTKKLDKISNPYTMLIIAYDRNDSIEVEHAFRIYPFTDENGEKELDLWQTPDLAFRYVLENFGLLITSKNKSGKFIDKDSSNLENDKFFVVGLLDPRPNIFSISASVKHDGRTMSIKCAFAINMDKYLKYSRDNRLK